MSSSTTQHDFAAAWHRLQSQWQRAGELWNDTARREFEAEAWNPIQAAAQQLHSSTEQLQRAIDEIRRSLPA